MTNKPKVTLTGTDNNAFNIMGKCLAALRRSGATKEEMSSYQKESTSGDYDNLLRVAAKYCRIS